MKPKSSRRKTPSAQSSASSGERFLLALVAEDAVARTCDPDGSLSIAGKRVRLARAEADELVARDLAEWRSDGGLAATMVGGSWAKRHKAGAEGFRVQHGEVSHAEADGPAVELAESPLLWLHRRRDAAGNPLIGDAMFAAGERLRADFTFGNMSPRVTLNWSSAGQGSRNPAGAEPSESALAARQRLRRALDVVGPELSGILLDVCCFLKRLEEVERDRHWPARSAKVILALALGRLAGHYGYSDVARGSELRRAG